MASNWSSFGKPRDIQLQSNNLRSGVTPYNVSSPAFKQFNSILASTNAPRTFDPEWQGQSGMRPAALGQAGGQAPGGGGGIMAPGQSGGYGIPASRLPGSVAGGMQQANDLNSLRYNQIQQLYDEMMGDSATFGQRERDQLGRDTTARRTAGSQSMIGRGLGNTTIMDTTLQGIDREADSSRIAISDYEARQRNSIREGRAGAIERRSDLGPDLSMAAALQRAASGSLGGGRGSSALGGSFSTPRGGMGAADRFVPQAHQSQYGLGQAQRAAQGMFDDSYDEIASSLTRGQSLAQQARRDQQDESDFWNDYDANTYGPAFEPDEEWWQNRGAEYDRTGGKSEDEFMLDLLNQGYSWDDAEDSLAFYF